MPPKRNTSNTVQPKPWDNGIVPSAQETWFMLSVLCHTTGRPEIDWNAVKRDMNYASCDTTKVRWGQVMRKLKRDDIKDGKYAYPGYDSDEANSPGEKKVRPGRKKGVPRTPKTPSSSIRKALKSSETAIDSDDDDDEVALSAGTKSSLAKPGNVINLTEDNNEDADDERAIQSQLRHETWGRRAAVPAAAERVHGYTGFDPHAAARRAAASNLTASATLVRQTPVPSRAPAPVNYSDEDDDDDNSSPTAFRSTWYRNNPRRAATATAAAPQVTVITPTVRNNSEAAVTADEANNFNYQGPGRLANGEIDLYGIPQFPREAFPPMTVSPSPGPSQEAHHGGDQGDNMGVAFAASAAAHASAQQDVQMGEGEDYEDEDDDYDDDGWSCAEPAQPASAGHR